MPAYGSEAFQEIEQPIEGKKYKNRPSFEIEDRIPVYLDYDLAKALSDHLKDTENPALYALGRQLAKL